MKKIIVFSTITLLLVFSMYQFEADAQQLPGHMETEIHEDVVILHTKQGKIVMELFPRDAPNHVENFLELTESGFYDRTVFHRIIPGFMIQGGDPATKPGGASPWDWGKGDPGYSIDAEFNTLMHTRGMVSMARAQDPDSAGSQFFIVHQNSNFLDGQYTVFGRLLTQESFDTLDKLAAMETTTLAPPETTNMPGIKDLPLQYGLAEIVYAETQKYSDIENKLDLGMPDRMSMTPEPVPQVQPYTNTEFGFSLDVPRGFLASEPERVDDGTPIVTLVGERSGKYSPTVYVQVTIPTATTFEEILEQRLAQLESGINEGTMELLYSDYATVNGMNGYAVSVKTQYITNSGPELITFKQFLFPTSNFVYSLVFSDSSNNFQLTIDDFDLILNSFTIDELTAAGSTFETPTIKDTIEETNSDEGGGCLIATAAFGSEMAPQVQFLRELRDNTVLQTQSGTSFMTGFNQFYYSFSPTVADLERENPMFKETVKLTLTPLLTSLTLLNYVNIDSESEMLGYGIGIIMLNIGMYFVAPAIIITTAKRFLTKQK